MSELSKRVSLANAEFFERTVSRLYSDARTAVALARGKPECLEAPMAFIGRVRQNIKWARRRAAEFRAEAAEID